MLVDCRKNQCLFYVQELRYPLVVHRIEMNRMEEKNFLDCFCSKKMEQKYKKKGFEHVE